MILDIVFMIGDLLSSVAGGLLNVLLYNINFMGEDIPVYLLLGSGVVGFLLVWRIVKLFIK